MLAFFSLIGLVALILEVAIIVKFFSLCSDVAELKKTFCLSSEEPITADTVRLAVLTKSQENVFNRIVNRTFCFINENLEACQQDPSAAKLHIEAIENKIAMASRLCNKMGYELPPQLRSVESFKAFLKETKC